MISGYCCLIMLVLKLKIKMYSGCVNIRDEKNVLCFVLSPQVMSITRSLTRLMSNY